MKLPGSFQKIEEKEAEILSVLKIIFLSVGINDFEIEWLFSDTWFLGESIA